MLADPPYGVRAGARKSVHMPYKPRKEGRDHYPSTAPYTLGECLMDLLDSASRLLRISGRLVYFLPVWALFRQIRNKRQHVSLLQTRCQVGLLYATARLRLSSRLVYLLLVRSRDSSFWDPSLLGPPVPCS